MRILYPILFFADTLLLVLLTNIFLQNIDTGCKAWVLVLIFAGMAATILLMIYLLKNYINQPPKNRRE
jgi:hypothetical protein